MSSGILPDENLLLYLNLSGELFYIVAHRMRSQRIESNLQEVVFNQLILAICSPEVINDLTQGHLTLSLQSFDLTRNLMKEIVDSTIMKINEFSMEKLFELTLIATKYQFTVCHHPKDILLIVLNHLDSLRKLATDPRAIELSESLHNLLIESYGSKFTETMAGFESAILNFLQEIRLKMTNLVNLGLQDKNGDFIKTDTLLHPEEVANLPRSDPNLPKTRRMHSFELNGDRVINLGLSIYDLEPPTVKQLLNLGTSENPPPPKLTNTSSEESRNQNDFRDSFNAVQGLEFCSTLLGGMSFTSSANNQPQRSFNLSTSQELSTQPSSTQISQKLLRQNLKTNTICIDARGNRADSKLALFEIARKLEASEEPVTETGESCHFKINVAELMETFALEEDA